MLLVCHDDGDFGVTGLRQLGVVGEADEIAVLKDTKCDDPWGRSGQGQCPLADVRRMGREEPLITLFGIELGRQTHDGVVVACAEAANRHLGAVEKSCGGGEVVGHLNQCTIITERLPDGKSCR